MRRAIAIRMTTVSLLGIKFGHTRLQSKAFSYKKRGHDGHTLQKKGHDVLYCGRENNNHTKRNDYFDL